MFAKDRRFTFLAVSHPRIATADQFLRHLMPEALKRVRDADGRYRRRLVGKASELRQVVDDGGLSAWHFYYYRLACRPYHRIPAANEQGPELQTPKTREFDGAEFYGYDCYLIRLPVADELSVFFLGVPFSQMLRDAVDETAPGLISEKASFWTARLADLCSSFVKENLGRLASVDRIRSSLPGSIYLRTLILEGDDVLRSEEYDRVSRFSEPRSVRVVVKNQANEPVRITFHTNGYITIMFRQVRDLASIASFVSPLLSSQLLKRTYDAPLIGDGADSEQPQ